MRCILKLYCLFLYVPLMSCVQTTYASPQNTENKFDSSSASTMHQSENPSIISRITPSVSVIESTYTGSNTSNTQSKIGFGAGLTVDIGRSNIVLETGILYRELGATENYDTQYGNLKITADLNYLAIPILAKAYFNDPQKNSFYLKGGLLPSFLISKKGTVSDGTNSISTSNLTVNNFDFAGTAGAGVKLAMDRTTSLIFEADAVRGFTNVSTNGGELYNAYLTLSGGVSIEL